MRPVAFVALACLTLASSAAQDVPSEVLPEVEAPRRFEVATIGSGAPEVLAWFGHDTPDDAELAWRRAFVDTYRQEYTLGSGRIHLVVDLGPSGPSERAFSLDFPSVLGTPGPPECLTRTDSRALAEYLVEHPQLVGILRFEPGSVSAPESLELDLASDRTELAQPRDRSLRAFRFFGLGLREVRAAVTRSTGLASGCLVLEQTLALARAQIRPAVDSVTHLGSDLWQLDLVLRAPELHPERPDPARTYPRTRLSLSIAATPAPSKAEEAGEGDVPPAGPPPDSEDGGEPVPAEDAAPELVELAWGKLDASTFERLVTRGGLFGFPSGDLPEGTTLRLVVRVPGLGPGASDSEVAPELEVTLDAARAGLSRCTFVLGV